MWAQAQSCTYAHITEKQVLATSHTPLCFSGLRARTLKVARGCSHEALLVSVEPGSPLNRILEASCIQFPGCCPETLWPLGPGSGLILCHQRRVGKPPQVLGTGLHVLWTCVPWPNAQSQLCRCWGLCLRRSDLDPRGPASRVQARVSQRVI